VATRPANLQFANQEKPPLLSVAVLASQHAAVVLINLVYLVIITKAMSLSAENEFAFLSTTILVCGIATILQARYGSGMLIVFHSNPIFIPMTIAAGVAEGAAGIAVFLVTTGIIQFALGSRVGKLRMFFPPEVCGVVVLMLGVSILPNALRGVLSSPSGMAMSQLDVAGLIVAACTVAIAAAGSIWLKGMARFFSLFFGCIAGIMVASIVGIGHFNDPMPGPEVAAISLPNIHVPALRWDLGLIYLAIIAALVNIVDELGVLIGSERLDDADWQRPDFGRLAKGLQSSGLFTAISGALGGAGLGMSSANLSLAYATGVTSRIVATAAGSLIVAAAFLPVLLHYVLSLADAVVAGLLFYAACHFIVSGAALALSRIPSPRRSLVIGMPVGAGILLQANPALASKVTGSSLEHLLAPMTFATLLAIILNVLMRIGIRERASFILQGDAKISDLSTQLAELAEKWAIPNTALAQLSGRLQAQCNDVRLSGVDDLHVTVRYDELTFEIELSDRKESMASLNQSKIAPDILGRLRPHSRGLILAVDC
jgi:xanthine permease XanP